MCTHVSEFVPSPRQPLIVQKIAAVGASGDVSEGDGAHTQQGDAQHLRTHNNSTERGHRIRLRDTAIASENTGGSTPHHIEWWTRRVTTEHKDAEVFFVCLFCCCCCCSLLPCGINRSPDCMCSLPFSVTSNSSPLSLSLALSRALSLSAPAVCAQRKAGARMAPCAGPASPPPLPLLSAEETVMMAHCELLSAHHKSVFHWLPLMKKTKGQILWQDRMTAND